MSHKKCIKSKPTRICALKYFLEENNIKYDEVSLITENRYNTVVAVKLNNSIKYYNVITQARFDTVKRRIAYPERFLNSKQQYRTKILSGHIDSIEHEFIITAKNKSKIFYIYELPVNHSLQKEVVVDKDDKDQSELVDAALDKLIKDKNLIDQFMYKINKALKDIIKDAYNRGYESGYSDGALVTS